MAFQVGTPVDPRLMQADYSGFARAAEIRASALADLGATIGDTIQKVGEKRQKKRQKDINLRTLKGLYSVEDFGGDEEVYTAALDRLAQDNTMTDTMTMMKIQSALAPEEGARPPVTGSEMKNTLDLLGVESAADISLENGDIILDPPGYFNTEKIKPDDPRYRILKETKGGQALLQGLDRFAGFSTVE